MEKYNMKPIVDLMDESIKKIQKLRFNKIKGECPEGHGKMKKTLTGVYWCLLCQKYYE